MEKLIRTWKELNILWRALFAATVTPALTFIAVFSGIEALYNYNIVTEWINKNLPHSYIYMGLLVVIIFVFRLLSHYINLNQGKVPTGSDEATLISMNKAFTKQDFRYFIHNLENSRAIDSFQFDRYLQSIERFTEGSYTLSNKKLDKAKKGFLKDLANFIFYAHKHFESTANPQYIRFKASMTEDQIMKDENYEDEEERFLKTARKMYKSWEKFHYVLNRKYPNFVWKETFQCSKRSS